MDANEEGDMTVNLIPQEYLKQCSVCVGCWDSTTGVYCRYEQDAEKCEGPKNDV